MRQTDLRVLFDYNHWANRQVLTAAGGASVEVFTTPSSITWRNLRGTLVHILDVERSWRDRVRGEPREVWDTELGVEEYPTVAELAERWGREEATTRAWLDGLDDEALASVVDLGGKDRFPMWYFLVHMLSHSAEQRRDATILLTNAGHAPPDTEFLWYADSLGEQEDPVRIDEGETAG